MRLTTKGRYAVTAVMDLAIHQSARPVTVAEIAERQSIPKPYLRRLLAQLNRYGLVDSQRGPKGGYTLQRAPQEICLAAVLDAVGESINTMRCAGRMNCQGNQQCLSHAVWEKLSESIRCLLREISLADLVSDTPVRKVAERQLQGWQHMHDNLESTKEATPAEVMS